MSRLVNVGLAAEVTVAVADSEFPGDAYCQRAGGRVKFVNDGVRWLTHFRSTVNRAVHRWSTNHLSPETVPDYPSVFSM